MADEKAMADRVGTFDEALAAWTAYFEADRDAAQAAYEKFANGGRLGQAEQLGLSVALTPPGFRCEHCGDSRYCHHCRMERREERELEEAEEENRRLESENERLRRMLEG